MYGINEIQKSNARSAKHIARGSFNTRPNGDVLLTYVADNGRTQRKTLTGDSACQFTDAVATNAKNGKINPRVLDGLIGDIFLPPYAYSFSDRGVLGVTITRKRGDESPEHRTLPTSRLRRFREEVLNITVPQHHAAKYRDAVSALVETHWKGARTPTVTLAAG